MILKEIPALSLDAVVISGDFTMRGRHEEYQAARKFLDQIEKPTLAIPGNHDQPLFAPFERLTTPYARYTTYVCSTIDATLSVDGLFLLGLSDCHPILPGGFWSRQQRRWIQEQLASAPPDAAKVVVSHHQFLWGGKWRPAGFWYPSRALDWLASQGVELMLNGHTHIPQVDLAPAGIVVARAGTATSDRTRHGWSNTYNLIDVDKNTISITVRQFDPAASAFVDAKAFQFPRRVNLS